MTKPYHVEVTVTGRADGLVIATHHFATSHEAYGYVNDVARHPLYTATDPRRCFDKDCRDHDLTRTGND